jgi:C-terminal processing protease CtpA/Prc
VTYGYITDNEFDSTVEVSYHSVKPADASNCYKGKVIILVNEMDLSSGEFSAMLLNASSANGTVISSQTAGADGGITQTVFPGGYIGQFTGGGVKYPNGRQTQGIGMKIDIEVKPTIAGFRAGKDEVLLRAIEFIKKGK